MGLEDELIKIVCVKNLDLILFNNRQMLLLVVMFSYRISLCCRWFVVLASKNASTSPCLPKHCTISVFIILLGFLQMAAGEYGIV